MPKKKAAQAKAKKRKPEAASHTCVECSNYSPAGTCHANPPTVVWSPHDNAPISVYPKVYAVNSCRLWEGPR